MKKVFTHMLIPKRSVGFLPRPGGMCLFLFISFLVYTQDQAVSGTLKDERGQPLPGAWVLVKPTSHGGTTADEKHLTCLIIKEIECNQILIL